MSKYYSKNTHMLKLRHRLSRSPFSQSTRRLQLSAVHHEDDELIEAIEKDHQNDVWTLDRTSDAEGLEEFWTDVVAGLKDDPERVEFAQD